MSPFVVQLADAARRLEAHLTDIMNNEAARGVPQALVAAMRHALLGGGKRFRPFLLINSAALFGVPVAAALTPAAAIECVHCYSLVHDDLPQMDNDEMRRGQPTVWKAFGASTAILAGDALQTLAFELISDLGSNPAIDSGAGAELVLTLARASGAAGMVGGQVLDLEAGAEDSAPPDAEHIARLQAMKTGRLITAACEMGAILGRASANERAALVAFGDKLGFAFQISDDLLDAEGSAESAGKATGKDAALGKATLVGLYGVTEARRRLDETVVAAILELAPFGERAHVLADAARFIGRRSS